MAKTNLDTFFLAHGVTGASFAIHGPESAMGFFTKKGEYRIIAKIDGIHKIREFDVEMKMYDGVKVSRKIHGLNFEHAKEIRKKAFPDIVAIARL